MSLLNTFARALCLTLGLVATAPQAHEITAGDLTITHPAARPHLPNRPTAAYMVISNDGAAGDRLISASSPAFGAVELHTSLDQDGVMKMIQVEAIDVPAGDAAVLAPGGLHIMLFQGAKAHKEGDSFPLELTFEQAGAVTVTVMVEKIGHGSGHGGHGHGDHGNHGANKHQTQ